MKNGHCWYAAAYDFVTRVVERQLGRHIRPLAAIEAAGFEVTELQRRPLPLTPLVIGAARLKT